MRTSRDLVRPLVALLVIAAAVPLVANVAAYRAATASHQQIDRVHCPPVDAVGEDERAAQVSNCGRSERSGSVDDDADDGARSTTRTRTGRTTTATTTSGAS